MQQGLLSLPHIFGRLTAHGIQFDNDELNRHLPMTPCRGAAIAKAFANLMPFILIRAHP